ncbi:sec1 family domain-containing protein 2-like isoform X2 [Lycorma delicatula]|uniref:sec1 family domain-containing protein 2-like isoform X2 n=1 Tax=Lycorma delicatula TaxID=130591 RepID=UPI003F516671
MDLPLYHLSDTWWQEVYKKVKNAVVFIDNPLCECLHWHGGVIKLFNAGAVACKEFSSFECASEDQKKGVFLTSGPVVGTVRDIVRDIVSASKFEYCILIVASGPTVQMFAEKRDSGHDMAAFQQLECAMLTWMGGSKDFTVELFSFPLFLAPITSNIFMMPIFSNVFPFIGKDIASWNISGDKKSIELRSLPFKLRVAVYHLTSCLQSLLSLLNVNDDIYCMGHLSQIIGQGLETHPQSLSRRKTAAQRATVILIDRSLDVAGPASYSSDCLLDRIKAALPTLPQHSCDVAVDMTAVCGTKFKSRNHSTPVCGPPPGSLCHPESPVPVVDWIINQKQYDVLLNLQKVLLNKTNLRITAQSFEKQVMSTFSGKYSLIQKHSSVLQQSLAVIKALTCHNVDMVMGIEKLQLMAIAAGGPDEALNQLATAIRTRHGRDLTLEQLLVVLVQLYSIGDPDSDYSADSEMLVQVELCKAIIEDRKTSFSETTSKTSLLTSLVCADMTSDDVEVLVKDIFTTLKSLSEARNHLTKYRSLIRNESRLFPVEYCPLILQLLQDLLNQQNNELPSDLISMSSGSKSSFSLLMRPNRHPMDNKIVLFFVVGGITGQEMKQIIDSFRTAGKHVIVGSTRFLSPEDVLKLLFTCNDIDTICI